MDRYEHISFRKEWEISPDCAYMLGESEAYVKALTNIPLKPEHRSQLLQVSLIKGAQATTAIEGNTLKEEDIRKIPEGWSMPPSKKYLEIEVTNILESFNQLLKEIVNGTNIRIIIPDLIKEFHQMIAKNLGEHLDAIPGRFRENSRSVGTYLAPDYRAVEGLVEKLCDWLMTEFHYIKGQDFGIALFSSSSALTANCSIQPGSTL